MKYKNIIFTLIIILATFALLQSNEDKNLDTENNKALISVSTFSLYDATTYIAGETADISMILPFGVDTHSYEPAPKEVIRLYESDLVIYSGAGLEPWISGYHFKNNAINMSLHVDLKELGEHDDEHNHKEHHEHHDDESTNFDPHYWLDIQNMIKVANYITKELVALFPQNKEFYTQNRDDYIKMLNRLDEDYKARLSSCRGNTIVVNHNAFSYLSSRYGFEVEALSGLSPEAEPSAKNMANLIEHVKEYKLKTIFFESFVSDKAIKSIANEAKVGVDVLQPLGNITADEAKKKLSYEDIMRSNLEKIQKALECH
jgi:zinc transport system substrate-binding protein